MKNQKLQPLPDFGQYTLPLVQIVAETSLLPSRKAVASINGPVFRTIRGKIDQRGNLFDDHLGQGPGMYDDNTSPRWALLWAHGFVEMAHMSGWTFAHIWPLSKDIQAYTNLANLAMLPECLSSLTDKNGPATPYLRYHAFDEYGWNPTDTELIKPNDYDEIEWHYFEDVDDPKIHIQQGLNKSREKRVQLLRSLWHQFNVK